MRIAMVGDFPADPSRIDGGVQAATKYLVDGLSTLDDVELHLVTFRSGAGSRTSQARTNVTLHELPRQRMGALTRWYGDLRTLRACLRDIRPDVVHGQGAGVEGYLALRLGFPSVITFHGMIGIDATFRTRRVERIRLSMQSRITERYCAAHCDHAILISPYVEKMFGSLLRGGKHHIPNAIGDQYYLGTRRELSGRLLFAGRLIPLKGVTILVHALAEARKAHDCRLVLAGSLGDAGYVSSLRQLAHELNVADAIDFRGLLSESELLQEFETASIVVLPSYQENAPMVIEQAMAAGVPVVATRVGGVPDIVQEGESGLLVEPGEAGDLARAIVQLLDSPGSRACMAANAKQLAERFRAIDVARRTVEVYRAAAGEPVTLKAC
jgi:glycosyltransferase involved in cell wall biosynthesis